MKPGRSPTSAPLLACIAASTALVAGGCDSGGGSYGYGGRSIDGLIRTGDFGTARQQVLRSQARNPNDRGFMLDKATLASLTLADGAIAAANAPVDELYDLLRQQGVNRDKTVATFLFGEGNVRVWRGEPFEQAMAYATIGTYDAVTGDWGNVRATMENALFAVRDFSKSLQSSSARAQARQSAASPGIPPSEAESKSLADREALIANGKGNALDSGFEIGQSDFELAYTLKAIATQQLGETQQAEEALGHLRSIAPRLDGLASTIASGKYNTVLIVDFGVGPQKYGAGPDQAIAMFRPRTASSDAPLIVRVNGREIGRYPVVTDVNRLALDVRWNNLEDMRRAKSTIGDLLIVGGVIGAAASDRQEGQLIGLGVALTGLLLKGTSQVDTRQNDALPQRVYVAPVWIDGDSGTLDLQIDGIPGSRLVVPFARVAGSRETVAWYSRLAELPGTWSTTGTVLYANDATGALHASAGSISPTLPYILGGRCVRTPSPELVFEYRKVGLPVDVSVETLRELYREEGIAIADYDVSSSIGTHILEGGNALFTPNVGSSAFARLYAVEHPSYAQRSDRVRELVQRIQAARNPTVPASPTPPPQPNPKPPTQGERK